jgi:uncharacterized protein YyaL (SSP411 family)
MGFFIATLRHKTKKFLNLEKNSLIIADFLKNTMMNEKGEVWRSSFEGKRNIKAGLTDYAYLIDAFVSLYQTTLDKKWLEEASLLMGYVESNFISPEKTLFQSSQKQLPLAVPIEMDYTDNVMPSANSVLAKNLFRLGHFYYDTARINRAEKMVGAVLPYLQSTPQYFANWMDVLLWQTYPYFEVAVAGPEAVEILKEIRLDYRPNVLWLGTETSEYLPLLEQKFVRDKTLIYVCLEKSCKLPVEEVEKAKKQLGMTIRNP